MESLEGEGLDTRLEGGTISVHDAVPLTVAMPGALARTERA
jgi:hypothetical protein